MKVAYTLVKRGDRYFELLCVYENKKKAKKDLKKLVKETYNMGFIIKKHGPYYEVSNYLGNHEYDLYIQPTDYKGGA